MATTPRRERSNPEWQALITQYQILKRKLQSKSEALLIISQDLDTACCERDQFKLMGEQLQEKCQALKKQHADFPISSDKLKLISLLKEAKSKKLTYQKQAESLQQKLNEANGDIKMLREKFARQTIGDEGIGARHFPLHEREKLVSELEQSQQECKKWKEEYESQLEVCSEVRSDCCDLKAKVERLNEELLRVLNGDQRRIVDVDALCMENKYLQDRITQCQEEKNTLHSQLAKYKEILGSRKNAKVDLFNPTQLKNAGLAITPNKLKQLLGNQSGQNWPQQLFDLQTIVSALLETINDKNLALHHLRNTNKILGNRVSDLEKKLKNPQIPVSSNQKEIFNGEIFHLINKIQTLDSFCSNEPHECSNNNHEIDEGKQSLDESSDNGSCCNELKTFEEIEDNRTNNHNSSSLASDLNNDDVSLSPSNANESLYPHNGKNIEDIVLITEQNILTE